MKIYPCTPKVEALKPEEKWLTWDEIQKEEGIYESPDSILPSSRLIVLEALLPPIYFAEGELEFVTAVWRDRRFRRTSERLCLEIRE
jgi:hypothetical protein